MENNIAFSEEKGITQLSFSLELDSISEEKRTISQEKIVAVNVKVIDEDYTSEAKISYGKPFSFRNADIYLEDIPDAGDDVCSLFIVYNKFKIYILIGIVLTIIGSLKLIFDFFADMKKSKSMGDNWITPVAFILVIVIVLLLYLLFPAIRGLEMSPARRKLLFFLHEISFIIVALYSIYIAVFGIVEYVKGKEIKQICKLPLHLNMVLIGVSVPFFMLWNKFSQGFFVTFDIGIISMLLSLIISFVFLKINEDKRQILCMLLIINMVVLVGGFVI